MQDALERLSALLRELNAKLDLQERRIKNLEAKLGGVPREELKPVQIPRPEQKRPGVKHEPISYKPIDWRAIEMKFGNYILQIIGVVVFLFGMGFLLKYSIDRGWISPTVRVIFGFAVATALVAGAEFLTKRLKQWALACTAGGIVVYYATSFAAYALYHLIAIQTTIGVVVATTALAVFFALRYSSLLIGVICALGSFLTPIFLGVDQVNIVLLASYLSLLALGFLVLNYAKQWYVLSLIGFFFFVVYCMYFYGDAKPLLWLSFFVVYMVIPFCYALVVTPKNSWFEAALLSASGFVLFKGFHDTLPTMLTYLGLDTRVASLLFYLGINFKQYVCFVLAGIYLLLLIVLFIRDKKNTALLTALFGSIIGLMFGFLANFAWSNDFIIVAFLACYLLGVAVLSFVSSSLFLGAIWGLTLAWRIVFQLSEIRLWGPAPKVVYLSPLLINIIFGLVLLVFVCGAYAAYRSKLLRGIYNLPILAGGMAMTIFLWMHTQVWLFPYNAIGFVSYAFVLFALGIWLKSALVRMAAYVVEGVAIAYFVLNHQFLLAHSEYFVQFVILFVLFALFALGVRTVLALVKPPLQENERMWLPIALDSILVLSVWGLGRMLILSKVILPADYNLDVALTIYHSIYAVIMIVLGLWRKVTVFRYIGLLLMAVVLGKLWFIIMAMRETVHRIIAFLIVGVLFTVASFMYQRLSKRLGK